MSGSGNIINIDNVNKTFFTEKGLEIKAIENFSMNVNSNDFVCIVGPSGCGKSTLLRIMAGLESATTGQIYLYDQPVIKPNSKVGMVFQDYSLFPWKTVIDNITVGLEFAGYGSKKRKQIANQYLELVGLSRFAKSFPYELSGGMRQRVAIARALATSPEVLLMDEPFGALDAHTRILLQKELLRIWEKNRKTILFVTHSVDEAIYLSDRIVVMSAAPGKVKEVVPVNMPRPRNRANPQYGQLSAQILEMLDNESYKSHDQTEVV